MTHVCVNLCALTEATPAPARSCRRVHANTRLLSSYGGGCVCVRRIHATRMHTHSTHSYVHTHTHSTHTAHTQHTHKHLRKGCGYGGGLDVSIHQHIVCHHVWLVTGALQLCIHLYGNRGVSTGSNRGVSYCLHYVWLVTRTHAEIVSLSRAHTQTHTLSLSAQTHASRTPIQPAAQAPRHLP